MYSLSKLIKNNLIVGLSKSNFEKNKICDACQLDKQTRVSFKFKIIILTSRPLELLHMDLFGPTRTTSLGRKWYDFVIIDDIFWFIWILFLAHKDESFLAFTKFYQKISNKKDLSILKIHSDHETEFKNQDFKKNYDEKRIDHNFSVPKISQQNGIVERKNRILKEMARTMLCESNLPKYFWMEVINIACYILNHALIRSILKKYLINFGKEENPTLHIFIFLVVSILF